MRTISFNTWDGGMTDDPRDPDENVCRVTKHFDNYSRKHKLSPYRDMVKDAATESTLDNFGITQFLFAGARLYGLGRVSSADNHAQVFIKNTGTPTDLWQAATTATSGSGGARDETLFVYYQNQNKIYGANATGIWTYEISNHTFTYNDYTTHIPSGVQGVVHSKDDTLYVPAGNLLLKNVAGSWSVALTLSSDSTITSICEDNNYLAVAYNRTNDSARVLLWDRDATLATLPEMIDWGTGNLALIDNLGGVLVGVSSLSSSATTLNGRVAFKYYNGSSVISFAEFQTPVATILASRQKFNNRMYFLAEMTINSTAFKGLWKIYKQPSGQMAVSFDILPRNDTTLLSGGLKGFYKWGDYTFIAYLNPADSTYTIWRTDDVANYTATSIYETTINPEQPERVRGAAGSRSSSKQLVAVALSYEPMPSGAQAVLKYRVDGGAWVSIFTETTLGQVTTERVLDASGTPFSLGREYEFHIESTGNAEITELKYKYEVLDTLI